MANKNNIQNIALQGEVCLNKNKIDIKPFTGFNHKNGQLYGDVLSPLRYKTTDIHNYYDKKGNTYDIANGAFKKNGETVFSYDEKGIKKTILSNDYIAYAHSDDAYLWVKESATTGKFSYYCSYSDTEEEIELSDLAITRKVKAFCNDTFKLYGFAVWYITSANVEKVALHWCRSNKTEMTKTSVISINNVVNPFIQVAVFNDTDALVSFYSNKGTDLSYVNTANVLIKGNKIYSNVILEPSGTHTSFTNLTSTNKLVTAKMMQYITVGNGYNPPVTINYRCQISIPTAWTHDIKVYHYHSALGSETLVGTIAAGSTSLDVSIATGSGDGGIRSWTGNPSYAWDSKDYLTLRTKSAPENPTDAQRQAQTLVDVELKLDRTSVYNGSQQNNGYINNQDSSFKNYQYWALFGYSTNTLSYNNNCKGIMDDGAFISPGILNFAPNLRLPESTAILKGEFSSITIENNTAHITYSVTKSVDIIYSGVSHYPYYWKSTTFCLSENNYRIIHFTQSLEGENKYLMYDLSCNTLFYNAGVNTGTYHNTSGGRYSVGSHFRLLFNNGMISGISCCESSLLIGTLLTDWYTVTDEKGISVSDNAIYYYDIHNNIIGLELTTNTDWRFNVIEDRYIVINTISYNNCYDMQTGKVIHYAPDWNNRIICGIPLDSVDYSSTTQSIFETTGLNSILIASGINANYEITKEGVSSLQIGAQIFDDIITGQETVLSAGVIGSNAGGVDFYSAKGSDSTVALYVKTFKNNLCFKKPDLLDAYFPVPTNGNILYSPTLFTKIVSTFNNRDMVISDGTSYILVYSNAQPVLLYQMLSGVDDMEDLFVIQTQHYGVSTDKIFELSYNDGVISSSSAVCNIEGMKYLGAIPTTAYFWSPINKTIYSFRGDAVLSVEMQANEINTIKDTAYNPASQELYIFADNNIIVISAGDMYKLEEFTNPKAVYFLEEYFIIVDDRGAYMMSYNQLEDYQSYKLKLETKFYGVGSDIPVNYDCWYIRLSNDGIKTSGSVKVRITTLTDVGFKSEEKEIYINASDWDKITDSYYLRYQPKYQKGVGAALYLETDFPVVSINCSYTSFDGAAQLSHNNI